jgi:flagellar protein FlbT
MALKLTLKPHERVILGGAVVRNGGSRVDLLVENEIPILRESDILSPSAVRTPCERVVLALQLVYVDPEHASDHLETYRTLVSDVLAAAPSLKPLVCTVDAEVAADRYYQAIRQARALLDRERELMSDVQ